MSLQHRLIAFVSVVVLLGMAKVSQAQVFANFEDATPDGFGTALNTGVTANTFSSPTTGSVVLGSVGGSVDTTNVLDLSASGFNGAVSGGQDLGFDFVQQSLLSQFMANDILTFQWGVPASSTTGGYAQLYNIILNAPGAGYHNVGGSSGATYAGVVTTGTVNQNPTYSGQMFTVSIDYTAWKSTVSASPSYLQLEFQTNNGGGAPTDFYFDNFTLSVPEPASIVLAGLGLAGLGLIAKRRNQKAVRV